MNTPPKNYYTSHLQTFEWTKDGVTYCYDAKGDTLKRILAGLTAQGLSYEMKRVSKAPYRRPNV